MSTTRRLLTPALEVLRRNGRPVSWTPEWMGFGNHLYGWFWAWRGAARGEERLVLRTGAMRPWLEEFPTALSLTTDRTDVRFTDRRLTPWRIPGDHDAPPDTPDWTTAELTAFVHEVLLASAPFAARLAASDPGADALVLNVRRGDFYDPEHVDTWGFDVDGFLHEVLLEALEDGTVHRLHVVSDDLEWCRQHLAWVRDVVDETSYAVPASGPRDHFAAISAARRLVVTNSTFSYWGGYVGDVLHGEDRRVWAPRFFDRTRNGGRSWLLPQHWRVVEDLPGGWAP